MLFCHFNRADGAVDDVALAPFHAPGGQRSPVFGRVVDSRRLADAVEAEGGRQLDLLLARVLMNDRPEANARKMRHACLGVVEECCLVNDLVHVIEPETLLRGHVQRLALNAANAAVDDSTLVIPWPH